MKYSTMLKPFFILLVLFNTTTVWVRAQGYAVFENIKDIQGLNTSSIQTLVIKDSLRGGTFFLYTGNDPVDNGMIFKDALNRKWLRQTTDETINVQWYGARAAASLKDTENDLYPKLMAAMNYVWNHHNFSTVRIPNDRSYRDGYICLSTVAINRRINIVGDGINTIPLTRINFPPNTKGFTTTFATPEGSRNAVKFHNLWLNGGTTGNFDSSAHMITPKGFIEVSQCVIEYTGGNGIHLEACSEKTSPNYGNVDGTVIEDVEFAFCNNGIYLNGCDANIVKMKRNFYTNMRRWGQYNNGFLGSQETDAHYSVNGYNNNCFANYNGKTWHAINADQLINIGKPPGASPEYWEAYGYYDTSFKTWNATKKYWSGGPFFASNDNGYSKYDYNYTEANQAPARVNNKTMVIGGDNGAGVKGGVFMEASNGLLAIRNSGMWLKEGNLGIGKFDANARLRVHQKTLGEPAVWISSDSLFATSLRFTNNTSPQAGEIIYNAGSFELTTQNTPRAVLNADGYRPYTSNTYDLGSPKMQWRNVYAATIGINTPVPNPSAAVDITSNTKGFLPPRMTSAEKKAIKNPAEGLMVYDLTLHKLCVYTGTKWEVITSL